MIAGTFNAFMGEAIYSIPLITAGFLSSFFTVFGTNTLYYYKKTKEHIEKQGELEDRYLYPLMNGSDPLCHYCPEQGVYLAAKETGNLDKFKKFRKEYSENIIPHF